MKKEKVHETSQLGDKSGVFPKHIDGIFSIVFQDRLRV